MRRQLAAFVATAAVLATGTAFGQTVPDWAAPTWWTPPAGHMTASAMSDLSNPLPFTAVTPCRVADTRGNGFTGAYGPPALAASGSRDFMISGQCGIPATARAVSFNFTVTGGSQAGDLRFYPTGGSLPLVSTINWSSTTSALANAAIVPLGGGSITVKNDSAATVQLIIDVNGYYGATTNTSTEYFGIVGAYGSGGGIIYGRNTYTGGLAYGGNFFAESGADGSAGLHGTATSSSGAVDGVLGETNSASLTSSGGANGVYGVALPAPNLTNAGSWSPAGVRGESANGWGMLAFSAFYGIGGFHVNNTTGNTDSGAYIGADSTTGVAVIGNLTATGTKSFVEPDPVDPSREIKYVALEGPEAGTYFRGRASTVHGQAVITVPESFRLVSDQDGITVQITPIGHLASFAVVSADLDTIVVESDSDVDFYYMVNGVRKAFKDFQAIQENVDYRPNSPNDPMPGAYSAEQKRILVNTGIYNQDGTVNMDTAERLGWAQQWRDRQQKMQADAQAARSGPSAAGAQPSSRQQ